MNGDAISIRPAVDFAWRTFKRRCDLFVAILLTTFAGWVALEAVVIAGHRLGIVLWVAAHLAFLIFFASIQVGFLRICLALHDGREPAFTDIFAPLPISLQFLAGQVVYLLMVVVGTALLIVPGAYLGTRYSLFAFCMSSTDLRLAGSFKRSAKLTAGRMSTLFSILVALFLFNVAGASLIGVGLFVTVPVSVLVMTAVDRQLSTTRQVEDIGRDGQI